MQKITQIGRRIPILVKLSPDLDEAQLEDALGAILDAGMDGVIATNKTLERPKLASRSRTEMGGLSGSPLRVRVAHVVQSIHKLTHGQLPIVGVGGVFNPDDARTMLQHGAQLLQVFTGLVYRGPGLVGEILRGLAQQDTRSGLPS